MFGDLIGAGIVLYTVGCIALGWTLHAMYTEPRHRSNRQKGEGQ